MLFGMIRRYTGRYSRGGHRERTSHMTWPEFVARVEEQTRLDDSARVLDIDVDHPCIDKELDLCVLAGVNHRSLANWIFIRNPTYKRRGYLMVWHNRGRVRPR